MLKKEITFTDYDGVVRTEAHYFNLSKVEIVEMNANIPGGMNYYLSKITSEKDQKKIWDLFAEIVKKSYGQKSPDGRRFIKSKELTEEFMQTEAYVELMMSFLSDAQVAVDFVEGIIPKVDKPVATTNA